MTVLFATPHDPSHPGGAGLVVRGRLQALRRLGHRVHLLLEGRAPRDMGAVQALCDGFTHQPRRGVTWRWLSRAAGRLLTQGQPLKWNAHTCAALERSVAVLSPDVVVLDDARLAEHGVLLRAVGFRGRLLLHAHNVEHLLLERQAALESRPGKRWELRLRARRFRAAESSLARAVDAVLALTPDDQRILATLNPGLDVRWVPPEVDTARYAAVPGPGERRLAFVGSLHWAANRDGVEWFLREVWPAVRARVPDARFTVVGKLPPGGLGGLPPGVEALGFVEDERPVLASARALVVPLRFGSGVRIKVLTAFAMARAVVSTPLGVEGIPAADGESLLLARDAAAFAEACVTLLEQPVLAERLGAAGHAVCQDAYAPASVAGALRAALEGASSPTA